MHGLRTYLKGKSNGLVSRLLQLGNRPQPGNASYRLYCSIFRYHDRVDRDGSLGNVESIYLRHEHNKEMVERMNFLTWLFILIAIINVWNPFFCFASLVIAYLCYEKEVD
jgi:hypothetical protein